MIALRPQSIPGQIPPLSHNKQPPSTPLASLTTLPVHNLEPPHTRLGILLHRDVLFTDNLPLATVTCLLRMMTAPHTSRHKAAEYHKEQITKLKVAAHTILTRLRHLLQMRSMRTPFIIALRILHRKRNAPGAMMAALLSDQAFPSTIRSSASARFTGM